MYVRVSVCMCLGVGVRIGAAIFNTDPCYELCFSPCERGKYFVSGERVGNLVEKQKG
jgi:hypothetical protein